MYTSGTVIVNAFTVTLPLLFVLTGAFTLTGATKHTTYAQVFKYHSDMGHCLSLVVVFSKKIVLFFYFSLFWKNRHGIRKKVAIFDWEWGRNLAHRDGQKIPCPTRLSRYKKAVFTLILFKTGLSLYILIKMTCYSE